MMSTVAFRQAGHSDGGPRMESSQSPRSIMCAIPAHAVLSFNPNADTLCGPDETSSWRCEVKPLERDNKGRHPPPGRSFKKSDCDARMERFSYGRSIGGEHIPRLTEMIRMQHMRGACGRFQVVVRST